MTDKEWNEKVRITIKEIQNYFSDGMTIAEVYWLAYGYALAKGFTKEDANNIAKMKQLYVR